MPESPIWSRFAPNLDCLWPDRSVLRRFELAAAHGFEFVEFLYPQDHDPVVVDSALRRTGLRLGLFNAGVEAGPSARRGLLTVPGGEEDFLAAMSRDLRLARRWDVRRVHAVAGYPSVRDSVRSVSTAVRNLRSVADECRVAGALVLVEFINPRDRPGYGIASFEEAVEIVTTVGHPAVRLQFDQYHLAMVGLDPCEEFRRHHELVGHVQVASVPGRHEPEPDSEQLSDFIRILEEVRYPGLVGLEYAARPGAEVTFAWLDRWR